jgi:hypothetical protein
MLNAWSLINEEVMEVHVQISQISESLIVLGVRVVVQVSHWDEPRHEYFTVLFCFVVVP